ncbi:MAG: tRNA lysidine(34) synthetase TilS [Thermodesulfobacteriota bacterium]|nr:tRNA lysidine(34) synthetase TilS [Thermodesulfobacteriota bacterium]
MGYSNKNRTFTAGEHPQHALAVTTLQKRIHDVIDSSSLLRTGEPVIIGVSGGADSICLLHILSVLFPSSKRIAVYVDHGLRPHETKAEKLLVQEQAELCSAHFETVTVDVQQEKKLKNCSLEEAARNLRYQALEGLRIKFRAPSIAVGHTADDQAEEILLRLIRGTGSSGLSGMNQQRGLIIRPLLHEKKETLLTYLQEQNIPFCEDSSNLDTNFLRNKIRLDLLPKLENEYNKSMRQTLLQTAAILTEEDKLLSELTKNCFHKHVYQETETLSLDLRSFALEALAIKRRIMEKICWTLDSRPSFKKIESLLVLAASQKQTEIHLAGGLRAVRQNNTIFFHRPSRKKGYRGPGIIQKTFSPITIPCPGTYPVPELAQQLKITKVEFSPDLLKTSDHLIVDATNIRFPLLLRHHKAGESFHPLGAPGRKKISRFFSDQKISLSKRDSFPLLLSKGLITALVGLRIEQQFRVSNTTKSVFLLQWTKTNSNHTQPDP